ncbi:Sodium/calcium exchanger membrane region domain-containing protein [Candidatus Electronema halotolerans]
MTILLFILGLALLIGGAEILVRGAARLAALFGISPLVIGLTVVAFGTSSPEFAVTIKSTLSGQGSLALGNVIGSNICNVLLILGLSAMITPLFVARQLVRCEVPLMILVSCAVLLFAWDGALSRSEGLLLILGLLAYIAFQLIQSRKEGAAPDDEDFGPVDKSRAGWLKNTALVISGLALLLLGSRWLVSSAVSIAQQFKVSEAVIGLTVIAVGTSLPEIVTSVIAALRNKGDIAVGNAVGSNLFNLLGVLGLAGIIAPDGVAVPPATLSLDLPVMLLTALACLPIFFTDSLISRQEGALFFGYYCAYTLHLILTAAEHENALPGFDVAIVYFAIPMTAVTLFTLSAKETRKRKQE